MTCKTDYDLNLIFFFLRYALGICICFVPLHWVIKCSLYIVSALQFKGKVYAKGDVMKAENGQGGAMGNRGQRY